MDIPMHIGTAELLLYSFIVHISINVRVNNFSDYRPTLRDYISGSNYDNYTN